MSCGPSVHRREQGARSLPRGRVAAMMLALLGLTSAAACDGCVEEPPVTNEPLIAITKASSRLPADGVTYVDVSVRAYGADGAADGSAVTVTVDGGTMASDVHDVSSDGRQLTGTPENGIVTFRFRCEALDFGDVTITAENSNASASSSIECIEPDGTVSVDVNLADCATLLADGQSHCVVPISAQLFPSNPEASPVDQEDLTFMIAVESATLREPAEGEDSTYTDLRFLTRDLDAQPPQSELAVTTGEDGVASFRFHSTPETLNKPMDVVLRITGTARTGQAIDQIATVTIGAFENRATVTVDPAPESIGSDQTSTLTITAINHRGAAPPDGGENSSVILSVPAEAGVVLRLGSVESVDGLLEVPLTGGSAEVEFDAPAVTVVTRVSVKASYSAHSSLPVVTDSADVIIVPDGSIILNVQASTLTIESDENTRSVITATVAEYNAETQTEDAVAGKTVRFSVGALSQTRAGIGTRQDDEDPALNLLRSQDQVTDSDGIAFVEISSRNERVRGNAEIAVAVMDDATGEVIDERTIVLVIERKPILQSIVFVSATPNTIGVRGGAYTSSSVLVFQVFDDLAQPLPNVSMVFDLSATADPEAVVVAAGTTDAAGRVATTVSAGTQAGPLVVVATARLNGREMTTESLPIAVTGGLPSFANSYIQCDPAKQVQLGPIELSCTVVLADRFTNRAPQGLPVQFRAEGGNIEPAVFTGAEGSATATFRQGTPGPSSTSLLSWAGDSWSYGAALPWSTADVISDNATRWDADAQVGCFDANPYTVCSVFDLCFEAERNASLADNEIYCPLLIDPLDEVGCWNKLEAGAVTGDAAHLSDALLAELGIDRAAAQTLLDTAMTPQTYLGDEGPTGDQVRRIVDAHLQNMFRCGPPTACIAGRAGGVPFIEGDECLVNTGCMDFNPFTPCPQDGLFSITAIVRGEESFSDLNGNGILDFEDNSPANGRHDPGERILENGSQVALDFHGNVLDMPEPFLDKDDNCFADDYIGSLRLTTHNAIRRSDVYNDEDGSGTYGYTVIDPSTTPPTPYPEPLLTNQQWDRDKQIFFSDHALLLSGAPQIKIGIPCDGQVGSELVCAHDGQTHLCESAGAPGRGVLVGCQPDLNDAPVAPTDSVILRYKWVDANGNCYSPEFAYRSYVFDDSYYNYNDLNFDGDNEMGDFRLTAEICGLEEYMTPRREWCTAMPALGSSFADQVGRTACQNFEDGVVSRTIAFTLTAGTDGTEDNVARHDVSYRLDCTP